MPEDDNDVEQDDSLVMLPEEDIEEPETLETVAPPAPVPVLVPESTQSNRWNWIGSPDRPEAQKESDGISDLFRVTAEDVGASEEDLSDLTDVDIEHDILDADEDGSLDDLVTVTEEDIMGDDDYAQRPSKPASQRPKARRRILPGYLPPTSMGRSR